MICRVAFATLRLLATACGCSLALAAQRPSSLPVAVTNNAVASGRIDGAWWIFSALGIDTSKRWSGITTRAVAWNSRDAGWRQLPDVPGDRGRLAATAQVVRGRLFVIGGYTVDSAGREHSVPQVNIYDVVHDRWSAAAPIPVPGVFGHSGALAGNTILFIDGALKQPAGAKYRLAGQSWIGTIDPRDPRVIAWRAAPPHPGPPLYRAAAGACGSRILIAGGTANPYNYDGIGYDGAPSAPRADVMVFDTRRGTWSSSRPLRVASMDHRALAVLGDSAYIVGGMQQAQVVGNAVTAAAYGGCD